MNTSCHPSYQGNMGIILPDAIFLWGSTRNTAPGAIFLRGSEGSTLSDAIFLCRHEDHAVVAAMKQQLLAISGSTHSRAGASRRENWKQPHADPTHTKTCSSQTWIGSLPLWRDSELAITSNFCSSSGKMVCRNLESPEKEEILRGKPKQGKTTILRRAEHHAWFTSELSNKLPKSSLHNSLFSNN